MYACRSENRKRHTSPRGSFLRGLRHAVEWFLLFLYLSPFLAAQAIGDPTFNPKMKALVAHASWTVRDGAPNNITAIAQTTDGYLWVGTPLGLYRFDGLHFTSYPTTPLEQPLAATDIESLSSDGAGGLWIGYHFGGISHLAANGTVSEYNRRNGLGPDSAQKFIVRKDGSVWALGDNKVLRLNGAQWEDFGSAHGVPPEQCLSLFFDSHGNLWTSVRKKLFVLRSGEARFALYPMATFMVVDIAETPDGKLQVSDGWRSVRPLDSPTSADIQAYGYVRIILEPSGVLWMAQDYRGVSYVPLGKGRQPAPEKIPEMSSEQTNAIFRDAQGNIWIGTSRGLDRLRITSLSTLSGVRLEYYPALAPAADGGVWIGALAHRLLHVQGDSIRAQGDSFGSSPILCDVDGSVWLVDPIKNALTRYENGHASRIALPSETRAGAAQSLGLDRDGKLLVSFDEAGLWRYDGHWTHLQDPALPPGSPLAIYRDRQQRVWLGYTNDVIAMQDEQGYHSISMTSENSVGNVLTFASIGNRTWVAGASGIAYFEDGQFRRVILKHDQSLRGVSGVVEDRNGDIWLNASSGIVRISKQELAKAIGRHEPVDASVLNDRQGLAGMATQLKPTPSAVADREGRLWFSTSGAVFSLDPTKIAIQQSSPTPRIEGISVDGKVYRDREHESAELKFRSSDLKDLEINYVGLDLDAPEQITYRYLLDGADQDWHDAGSRRQASYNSLNPGTYTFRVQATSGQGRWMELATPVIFTVTPAFYQRWWFHLCLGVLVLGVLYLCYLWRVRAVTTRLRERLKERTEERVRIARELHDTLLQSVQGLMLRFHFATEALPPEEPTRASLQLALSRADEVLLEGRRRVQDLREEVPDVTDFGVQIAQLAEELGFNDTMTFRLAEIGHRRTLQAHVQVELCRIAKEALTNSLHHSGADEVEVSLQYGHKEFVLECHDTGAGIPSVVLTRGHQDGHWGLVGMRERAATIRGKLEVWSSLGNGTRISVRVPSRLAYRSRRSRFRWVQKLLLLERTASGFDDTPRVQ